MSCIGKKCEIREQKGQNVKVKEEIISDGCMELPNVNEKVAELKSKAIQEVLNKTNKKAEDDCEALCVCSPQKGATTIETDWEEVPFDPVTATEGDCSVTIKGTVEVKVTNTPGLCRMGKIASTSIGSIPEEGLIIYSEKKITPLCLKKIKVCLS